MCYTQEKLSSGNPLLKSEVAVLEMVVGNKVSNCQHVTSTRAHQCNQMKVGLHCSLNELLFDARVDLPAGRATLHAACGGTSNGADQLSHVRFDHEGCSSDSQTFAQWARSVLKTRTIVEGGWGVSVVCITQAAGGLGLSVEHSFGELECCVVVANVGVEEHEHMMEVDVDEDVDVEMDVDIEMGDAMEDEEDIEMCVEVADEDIEMQG